MTFRPPQDVRSTAPSPDDLSSPGWRLLERSAAAMALADLQGRITYANTAFLDLWGLGDQSEAVGRNAVADFWVDPDAAEVAVHALLSQNVWQGELTARQALGRTCPVRVTANLLRDIDGQPVGMMATFVDISAETRALAAWQSEREFNDFVLGSAGVLVVVLDEGGRFVRFNAECERISGWRAEEALGRRPWDTVLPPDLANTVRAEAFAAAFATSAPGETTKYTNEWQARDGTRRLIDWTNRIIDPPGGRQRHMVSIGVDITARDAAQQLLQRSQAQLQQAQAVAKVGSWELDLITGRLEWTPEVFKLFEIDPAKFGASYQAFLSLIHPDDLDEVDKAYARSLETRAPYGIEHRLLMPDGRIKWVEERGESDFDAFGAAVRSRGTVQDVTDRHHRGAELLRFRHMVEEAPQEIWLSDERLRIRYANAAAATSLGCPREQLIGMSLTDLDVAGSGAMSEVVRGAKSRRSHAGPPSPVEVEHRTMDGRTVTKDVRTTELEIDGEHFDVWFASDITERKRTQAALAESEAQLRDALDAYPGWVACVDDEMRYVYVNARFEEVAGRPVHAIIGLTTDEVLGEKGSEIRRDMHRRLLAGEQSIQVEQQITDASGRERLLWIEYRCNSQPGEKDKRRRFYAFGTDITELRRTEQRLSTVTEGIGVGLWEWHLHTQALDFNDELAAIGGYRRDELDRSVAALLVTMVDARARARRRQTIAEMSGGRAERAELQFRIRHRDGRILWVQEQLRVASRDGAGAALALMGAVQDISTLKAHEARLYQLNAELEERIEGRTKALAEAKAEAERANAAKSDFLSQMSHELRTPLNAIVGFSQLLEMARLPEEEAEYVQEVMRAGRLLQGLIDEVLDLATVESGHVSVLSEPVHLAELVRECTRLMRPIAAQAELHIEFDIVPQEAAALADRGRLRQVLLNLLSNAVKYNRRGGRVSVTVASIDQRPDGWELRVSDTGPGLTAEQVGHLFQPFERLGAAKSGIAGTGIGLSVCKRLVDLMGGEIGLSSVPGQGSTAWVRLPAAGPGAMRAEAKPPEQHAQLAASAADRRRVVLYVEDNPANQRLVQHFLRGRHDIELLLAADAGEAMSLALQRRPELLMLDIQLPEIDGYELLGRLRADGVDAPAIAVSANAMPQDLQLGLAAGFDDYLTKPLDLQRLLRVMNRYLAQPR